jgi:hypothetical protein
MKRAVFLILAVILLALNGQGQDVDSIMELKLASISQVNQGVGGVSWRFFVYCDTVMKSTAEFTTKTKSDG